jgi:hypothetical protein
MKLSSRFGLLVLANVLFCCVLGFYQTSSAQRPVREPFANAVQQRAEANKLLADIKSLLAEQNALLRSGRLKVVVDRGQPTP